MILRCDCNGYYASVETLRNPALRDVPMAVAGDPDSRHGIILAKNEWAKKYGVQTAETIWQARQKCPNLVCVAPHHDKYSELSREINRIYLDYTDLVDPFGIDESFLDLTGVMKLHKKTPLELAHEIRLRVKREQGITISVGVSFCRVFAKLGSDYKKPDAVTVFSPDNWQERVWPLPASALLFVGRRTAQMLEQHGIHTIGDLAAADRLALGQWLGKQGDTLWRYANGLDREPVRPYDAPRELKSVGNGMTFRRDLVGEAEIRCGVAALCDSGAAAGPRAQVRNGTSAAENAQLPHYFPSKAPVQPLLPPESTDRHGHGTDSGQLEPVRAGASHHNHRVRPGAGRCPNHAAESVSLRRTIPKETGGH